MADELLKRIRGFTKNLATATFATTQFARVNVSSSQEGVHYDTNGDAMSSIELPAQRAFLTNLISALPAPTTTSKNPLASVGGNEKNLLLTLHVLFPNEFLAALDLLDRELVAKFRIVEDADAVGAPENKCISADQRHDRSAEVQMRAENTSLDAPGDVLMSDTSKDVPDHDAFQAQSEPGLANLTPPNSTSQPPAIPEHAPTVFYVRSAQQQKFSRFSSTAVDSPPSYEVRLDSWNCSCPAFAFAAFPAAPPLRPDSSHESETKTEPSTSGLATEAVDESSADHSEVWQFGGLSFGHAPVCKHLLACVLAEYSALFTDLMEERVVGLEEAAGWAAGWGA